MTQAYNTSTQEMEVGIGGTREFKASLGIMRPHLKKLGNQSRAFEASLLLLTTAPAQAQS